MSNSYSLDLRQRVIESYENQEGSMRHLAIRYKIHFTTVRNWVKQAKQGNLAPRAPQGGNRSRIQEIHKPFLEALYQEKSDMTHKEACQRFFEQFGKKLSESAM